MNAEHIKNILGDYLIEKDSQYALLINSAWGSGKTFFWKQQLLPIVQQKLFTPIYISLNGISKIETIEYKIIQGIYPFLAKKENSNSNFFSQFLGNGANIAFKKFTGSNFSELSKGLIIDNFKFSDKLICFDDLERCQIPIAEVLGFINDFIEHKSAKVIFLADENRFSDNEYQKIKEKIIRHTLNFEPSLPELIPQLLLRYKDTNPDFYLYLQNEKDQFTNTLLSVNEKNLRNISFIMDNLQKLFPVFRNQSEDIHKEVIFFSIIISIEYKTGNLKSTDYNDHKNLDRLDKSYQISRISKFALDQRKKKEENVPKAEDPYEEKFYLKYLKSKLDNYYFYISVYRLILSGYLDVESFTEEIKKRKKIVISKEQKDLLKITEGNYKRLEQQEFDQLVSTVWNNAIEGKYPIYDYPHLINHYHYFALEGLIDENIDQVKEALRKGLDIAIIRKELDNKQLQNMMAFVSPDHIQEFKNIVQEYHYKTEEKNYLGYGEKLIIAFNQNDQHHLQTVRDQIVATIYPIFDSIDKDQLFDAILKTNNAMLCDFTSILLNRYHRKGIQKSLISEFDSFEILRTKLKDYLTEEKSIEPLRRHILQVILKEIDEVLNYLENKIIGSPR